MLAIKPETEGAPLDTFTMQLERDNGMTKQEMIDIANEEMQAEFNTKEIGQCVALIPGEHINYRMNDIALADEDEFQ